MNETGITRYSSYNTACTLHSDYYKDYIDYMIAKNKKRKKKKLQFIPPDIKNWLKKTKKYTDKEIAKILRHIQCACCYDCTQPAGFRSGLVYPVTGEPMKCAWFKHYEERHPKMFNIIKYVILYVIICSVVQY